MLNIRFKFIVLATLVSVFAFLNLEAQETAATSEKTDSSSTKTQSEFQKSFQTTDKVLFERRNESLFEVLTGPFSFHEYDDQLISASEFGFGLTSFTDTGRYGSGINIIFGNSTVQESSGTKLDGQYFSISQQFLKRMQICPGFSLLANVGVGFISGEVSNVAPDKSYFRLQTDQKLSLLFRVLGSKEADGKTNPTNSGLYLNVGVKNLYVINEPTVVAAGFGSNVGWFINLSIMNNNWLPVGSN